MPRGKGRTVQPTGFLVADKQCSTCIFGPNSPLTPERFAEYRKLWKKKGVVQECHVATANELLVGCRGHYEMFRKGMAENHPVRNIATQMGFPETMSDADLCQIFERLGSIQFVELPDNHDSEHSDPPNQ